MTFKQAKQKGWSIRKGSKATPIIYFQQVIKERERENAQTGELERGSVLRWGPFDK